MVPPRSPASRVWPSEHSVANHLAAQAIADARDRGGDSGKIADAEDAVDEGAGYRDDGRYKDAVAQYKDAISQAEGA